MDETTAEPKERTTAERPWLEPLLALGMVAAGHWPALRCGWALDDASLIAGNPHVQAPSGLPTLLKSALFWASGEPRAAPYYRPLAGAANWLSYRIVGGSTAGQHAINLALHAVIVALFVRCLRALGVGMAARLGIGLVLAVHPAASDIVAYLGGRQDMGGWIAVLAVLPAMWTSDARRAALLAFGGTLIAVLFREAFVVAPVLLAVAALTGERADRVRRAGGVIAGGAAALGLAFALRHALAIPAFAPRSAPIAEWIGTAGWVGAHLLGLVSLLSPPVLTTSIAPWPVGAAAALLVAIAAALGALVFAARRHPQAQRAIAVGATTFALMLAVHLPIAIENRYFADRYAYGAVLALVFLLGAVPAAGLAPEALAHKLRWLAVAPVALAPLAWSRDAEWRDNTTLQLAMYREHPDDPEARLAMGLLLFARGDLEGAIPLCRAFAAARPADARAGVCIGTWELEVGRNPAAAAPLLERYLRSNPGHVRARMTYLRALFALGDLDAVDRALAMLLEVDPEGADLHAAKKYRESLRAKAGAKPPGGD